MQKRCSWMTLAMRAEDMKEPHIQASIEAKIRAELRRSRRKKLNDPYRDGYTDALMWVIDLFDFSSLDVAE
jgi:hypothetical protein